MRGLAPFAFAFRTSKKLGLQTSISRAGLEMAEWRRGILRGNIKREELSKAIHIFERGFYKKPFSLRKAIYSMAQGYSSTSTFSIFIVFGSLYKIKCY